MTRNAATARRFAAALNDRGVRAEATQLPAPVGGTVHGVVIVWADGSDRIVATPAPDEVGRWDITAYDFGAGVNDMPAAEEYVSESVVVERIHDLIATSDAVAHPQPEGPITTTWYQHGYRAALADLAAALRDGGAPAARAWIEDNYRPAS